jgi:hypothetical protein
MSAPMKGVKVMYAGVGYYKKVFKGMFAGDNGLLKRYLALASAKVDELTFGRIKRYGFNDLTEFQKESVRTAVCYQAEWYAANGVEGGGAVSVYRALDVSVTYGRGSRRRAEAERFSDVGLMVLEQCGLASRAI